MTEEKRKVTKIIKSLIFILQPFSFIRTICCHRDVIEVFDVVLVLLRAVFDVAGPTSVRRLTDTEHNNSRPAGLGKRSVERCEMWPLPRRSGVTFVKQTKCRKIPERQHTRIKAHYQQLGFRCVLRPGVRLPSTQGTSSSSRQWWTHIGYQSLQSVRCAVTYFWILRDFGTSALEEGREGEGGAEEVQWVFSMSVKLC